MANNPIFPLYYNDIDRSTRDWTDEEFGAYMRLLMHQWDKFGLPLGFDRLSRIAPSVEKNWGVLSKKFTEVDGQLKNERLEEIRGEMLSFRKKQAQNGSKGGRPKANKNPNSNPGINPNDIPKQTLHTEDEVEVEDEVNNNNGATAQLLIPQMLYTFKAALPNYPENKERDSRALLSIAKFLCQRGNLRGAPEHHVPAIMEAWEQISAVIASNSFYFQKSLTTISTHIQEIIQKALHGDQSKPAPKAAGNGKLDDEKLKEAIRRRTGGG